MALITKYAIYFDLTMPQIPYLGGGKISPIDFIKDCFGCDSDEHDVTKGVVIVDLGEPDQIGENVGFGMTVLKNHNKLPHSLICLQMDDSLTAAPGTGKIPIEDAISALASWGGREISSSDALLLATHMFPARIIESEEGNISISDPKLVNDILKRDITLQQ